MSILSIALPVEASLPMMQTVVGTLFSAVRPLLGIGAFITFLMMFKPLIAGVLRLALFMVQPEVENQPVCPNAHGSLMLKRMADELTMFQPVLAAELRLLALNN
jgi:hypothetical protein